MYNKYITSLSEPVFVPLDNILKGGTVYEDSYNGISPLQLKTRDIEYQTTVGFLDISNNDISTKYCCYYDDYITTTSNIIYPVGCSKVKVLMIGAAGSGGTADQFNPEGGAQGGGSGGSGSLLYFEYVPTLTTGFSLVIGSGGITAGQSATTTSFTDLTTPNRINYCYGGTGALNSNNVNNSGGTGGTFLLNFGDNTTALSGTNGLSGNENGTGASARNGAYFTETIYNGTFFPSTLPRTGNSGRGSNVSSSNWGAGQGGLIRIYFEY